MRFEEAYEGCQRGRLTQEAARLLGVCERTYRRYLVRYEEQGMEGLIDRRLGQISHRSAPGSHSMGSFFLIFPRYPLFVTLRSIFSPS